MTIKNYIYKHARLLFALGLAASLFALSVEGQSNRPRRVNEDSPQKESNQNSNPTTTTETQPPLVPAQVQGGPVEPQAPVTQQPRSSSPQNPKKPGDKVQDPEPEPIRIKTNLVTVPVSITDAYGNPIRNLKAEDFLLEEDGVSQQIQTLGEPGKTPIDLSLLFDISRSLRHRFDFEREAAGRFLRAVLKSGDAVSVFSIGSTPKLSIARTDNVEGSIGGTLAIQPTEESTAFFDSVVKAARYLSDNAVTGARRVMVVLSDGEDTNSERFRLGDATRELQRSDSLFYAINPSGPSIRLNKISTKGHEAMVRLANETGGVAFLPDKIEDLTQVFNQITAELQAQYLLGYYSSNDKNDGQLRKISVRVPKQPELRIRARKGYYAPKD